MRTKACQCGYCGKPYEGLGRSRFCSIACRSAAHRERKDGPAPPKALVALLRDTALVLEHSGSPARRLELLQAATAQLAERLELETAAALERGTRRGRGRPRKVRGEEAAEVQG